MNGKALLQKARSAASLAGELAKCVLLYPVSRCCYGRREIYLFSERGKDARDNGYHLYRYVREHHPEINAYFVITRDSADRKKLEALGNLVDYRSLKHYLLCLSARYLISTHHMGATPASLIYTRLCNLLGHPVFRGKHIFLQHGITKDDIPALYQEKTKLDLFFCGAKPEYDFVSRQFGYKNGEVRYTGFARFDALHDAKPKRQVLIMPTWRSWLVNTPDQVPESEFAKRWNSFLSREELTRWSEQYGVQFLFYPHFEMQKHIRHFTSGSPGVKLADFDHYDVQQLLKESMLLITDYSSVFFDFAYMHKPVLYYQFDEERFFAQHYHKGYFDYRRDGFGEVISQEEDLIEKLGEYLENGCCLKPEYEKRIAGFFPLHDQNNCQRILTEIQKQV